MPFAPQSLKMSLSSHIALSMMVLDNVPRGYGTVSSQYLAGNSSADLSKRVNYKKFANRVLGICGICDIPSDDERTPIPLREVQLETPVNSPLYNLWKDIPEGNKVPTGGFKHWKLDTTKAAQYGATDVYGCTIVIMLDGNDLLIGHYPQVFAGGTITMNDASATKKEIIDPIEATVWTSCEFSTATVAWIVHQAQSPTTSVGYRKIVEALEINGMSEENIQSQLYTNTWPGQKGALGKIAVNWVPRDDGGATLELYLMNENPRRYAYDANGNNCGTVPS